MSSWSRALLSSCLIVMEASGVRVRKGVATAVISVEVWSGGRVRGRVISSMGRSGECIAVHMGQGEWLINDSCVDSDGSPAALTYLDKIGVRVEEQVKLVVASHWHDDHVRGLSEMVRRCAGARFLCSTALGSVIFLRLVTVAERDPTSLESGASEFRKIIDIIDSRDRNSLRLVAADQLIWRNLKTQVSVYSLSPSTASVEASLVDIAKLVDEVADNRVRVAPHSPNAASVVLWIDLAGTCLLLGGGLENHSDSRRGWSAILNSDTRPEGQAEVYKVAHHGSGNAHNGDIWQHLPARESHSVLTPWRRGGHELPQPEVLRRIISLSARTHLTSKGVPKQIRRSKLVTDELAKVTRNIRRIDPPSGHVQMRKMVGDAEWTVNATPSAAHYTRL